MRNMETGKANRNVQNLLHSSSFFIPHCQETSNHPLIHLHHAPIPDWMWNLLKAGEDGKKKQTNHHSEQSLMISHLSSMKPPSTSNFRKNWLPLCWGMGISPGIWVSKYGEGCQVITGTYILELHIVKNVWDDPHLRQNELPDLAAMV